MIQNHFKHLAEFSALSLMGRGKAKLNDAHFTSQWMTSVRGEKKNQHWMCKSSQNKHIRIKLYNFSEKEQKLLEISVLTCWITLTRSFSTCLRFRTSLFVMTAVVRYRRIWGHIVWIALRYLKKNQSSDNIVFHRKSHLW